MTKARKRLFAFEKEVYNPLMKGADTELQYGLNVVHYALRTAARAAEIGDQDGNAGTDTAGDIPRHDAGDGPV